MDLVLTALTGLFRVLHVILVFTVNFLAGFFNLLSTVI
jgi:uncharacterized membrane protein